MNQPLGLAGRATSAATQNFAARQPAGRQANYRQSQEGLTLSSLGIGTYLGDADSATDLAYQEALDQAIALGCNVIDCAINYRFQRSERAVGAWLKSAIEAGIIAREEVVIASKGGFVPYEGQMPAEPKKWVSDHFLAEGTIRVNPHEFAARYQHCISPAYLEQMIAWSRRNLGLQTIDIYYLHNPETQSIVLSADTFRARMLDALETLEVAVAAGHIGCYGLATWNGFRALTNDPAYLSLTEIVAWANEVAGGNHHLRYVQLPYNLIMTEAFAFENQQVGEQFSSAIEAANALGLTVMTSAGLMQGRLSQADLPDHLADLLGKDASSAQRALQFARSSPGVTTALVGMKQANHVQENLALTDQPPVPGQLVRALYQR
jgi:aryl-alcohol dehydrogenase-like predicted oxidoreductase